jgi:UDP-glucose/iron transport system permease protein
MTIGPTLDWRLVVALVALTTLAVVVARLDRLPTSWQSLTAAVRAVVQLLVVAGVLRLALEHVWSACLFACFMVTVATFTSAGRAGTRRSWPWIAVALLCGQLPVFAVIFGTGSTEVTPPAVVAICGIVIGGTMTACSLLLRRAFAAMNDRFGQIEAGLALGLQRPQAIRLVIDADRADALIPVLDQTRTVGLVTLPGAFIGVLLGGGSPADAAAAQLIVLVGLVAAETVTVVVATRLVASGRILPDGLATRLPPN